MLSVADDAALEKLVRPLGREMSLELATALTTMKSDAETQARYETLARSANEGSLSPKERDELEGLVRANTVLGLLKAEAHVISGKTQIGRGTAALLAFNTPDRVRLRRKIARLNVS